MDLGDIMDASGALGPGRFLSREALLRQNEQLREALRHVQEENTLLSKMLARSLAQTRDQDSVDRPAFPISDAAIDLFEELPDVFTLDEVLDAAERIGQASAEGARLVRTYLDEEMVAQNAAEGRFVKTGRKPYF